MKGKILTMAVLIIVGLLLFVNGQVAQARVSPAIAVDNVFTAINAGDVESAVALFAADATAENLVRSEAYRGIDEIRQMLDGMQRDGRLFEIVNSRMEGDKITARVEVSDGGIVWGTETVEARVKDDRLQSFVVTAFRLELWRIGR